MRRKKKNVELHIVGCTEPNIESLKLDHPNYEKEYANANFYLRTLVPSKELKKEMVKWIKNNKDTDSKPYSSLEDWRFSIAGKFCYLLNRGAEIPENAIAYLEEKIEELEIVIVEKGKVKQKGAVVKVNKKSIQDYLKEHALATAGEFFEPWFDEFMKNPKGFKAKDYDPLTILRTEELKQGHVRYIIKSYNLDVKELKSIVDGTADEDLMEGYKKYTPAQLKQCLNLYEEIISACNMVLASAKATRKPRKKKAQVPTKLVSRLKIAVEDARTGIVSVNPVDILGAKEAWFYNIKTRKLGKFVALDSSGLSVKGASIIDFSEDKSIQKNLRKPPEQMKKFKNVKTRQMNKEFSGIRAMETKVKGKVNIHVVIFKVFK